GGGGGGGGGGAARRTPRSQHRSMEPEEFVEETTPEPRYRMGERVRHRKFGGGVVRAVSGMGRDLKVTVAFDDAEIGTKQLLAAYAGLERDWEGEGA
ncbi:MAG TPA: hypothetical protein VEO73_02720, partial [Gemmatimonadales bacterium]|nr:hypothetical protein [Gemmatimonadales bacterium]